MNNRLLVDTNVLIYAIDADSQFHKKAEELILSQDYDLYITSKNIAEFLVVLTRTETIKIDVIEALEILIDLLLNIKILYPGKETFLKFEELLRKYHPSGLRIHDFEIVSIGLASGIDHIATQNIDDFKNITEIKIKHL